MGVIASIYGTFLLVSLADMAGKLTYSTT